MNKTKAIDIGWWIFKKTLIYKNDERVGSYTKKGNVLYVDFSQKPKTLPVIEYSNNVVELKRKIK